MRQCPMSSKARPTRSLAAVLVASLACLNAAAPAQAQTRPALVRSVDEPARVPYGGTMTPSCPFSNQCSAAYPTVPAGKRLRVTAIAAHVRSNTSSGSHLLALHRNSVNASALYLTLMPPMAAAYYGPVASTSQPLDMIFEAGETPVVELGLAAGQGGISASNAALTLTGYLVDVAP